MTTSLRRSRGFTLIELMIATAVSAVLAGIAYPSFHGVVLKARRADALSALMQLHLTQERWRSNHLRYAGPAERPAATSPLGHYRVEVVAGQADGFVALATATGAQAADRECRVLRLSVADGQPRYASGADVQVDNAAPLNKRCWNL